MKTNKIVINTDSTRTYGSEFLNYQELFASNIQKFESIIDSINTVWEGNDSLQYINVMREKCITNLSEMNSLLRDYGNYLKDVGNTYDALDETFVAKKIDV